jgi:hypothetical protein
MLCKNCNESLKWKLYTQAFTKKKCDICDTIRIYSTWYNPKYCCSDCSILNKKCESCSAKIIIK